MKCILIATAMVLCQSIANGQEAPEAQDADEWQEEASAVPS
jgi:hypothetical protein